MLEESGRRSGPVDAFPSQRAKYHDLFTRMPDPILLLSIEDHQILDANLSSEKILKLPREKLIGNDLRNWLDPTQHAQYEKALRIAARRHYPYPLNLPWRIENSVRQMNMLIGTLKLNDQSEVIQILARDFTEQYEAEKRAEAYLNDLETTNLKLHILSTTDDLTQLSNIRYFKTQLEKEHNRAVRYGRPYSIIFLDVDHFKQYNDRNGHVAGDTVLQKLGSLLRSHCRNSDHPCRYGGEEFVVLCTETTPTDAMAFIDRFRKTFASYPFENAKAQPLGHVSVSAGVAGFPENGDTPEEIISAADEALYHSKELGRNRITLSRRRSGNVPPEDAL